MGPIQASLNQLTLSTIGAVGGLAHGLRGAFATPKQPTPVQNKDKPQSETTSAMGNIAKIGRNYSRTNIRSYEAAVRAVESGNDAIISKAYSRFNPIEARLEQINKAVSNFVALEKENKK